jgi:SH3-like domain-containing protein
MEDRPSKKSGTKNVGRQKRMNTAVSIEYKSWRRIRGLDGGLSKL